MNDTSHENVWIFHGQGAQFASAVFTSEADGRAWAARHRATGVLTEYPVGDGCYDIAVREGRFRPSKDHHGTPDHVVRFGPGLDHVHLHDGDQP
ncbi:hypothetical protein AB0I28_35795 [Phytomonospora sp. NPDC050363]|uniref:DUF7710 domain-containing protein n=1 Tax=Phytomonospora sp. NPDC050363 TaxID=3155642 RepID=UPI0033E57EF5